MKLNENLNLILTDVHLYDIEACHYTILSLKGYDLSGIDPNDKLARNIAIGKMMRSNPRITSMLRKSTESIIDDYILKNNITEDEIVIRQYDGFIITRQLECTNIGHINLNRRKTFRKFITSIDRKMYIAIDTDGDTTIKGVSHEYDEMGKIYSQLCKVAEMNKNSMFSNLQKIKDYIFKSTDIKLFSIPTKSGKFVVFLKGYGEIEVSPQTLKIMDTDDIDRQIYFTKYIEPFTKSIVYENIK